jgi:hypothetical protein
MQFLTSEGCKAWVTAGGSAPPGFEPGHTSAAPDTASVHVPGSVETLTPRALGHLARVLVSWILEPDPLTALIWVRESGVWDDHDRFLYQLLRKEHGDYGSVEQSPGHRFMKHEKEDAIAALFLCLSLGWGLSLLGQATPRAVHIDHDGHVRVHGIDDADAGALAGELALTIGPHP